MESETILQYLHSGSIVWFWQRSEMTYLDFGQGFWSGFISEAYVTMLWKRIDLWSSLNYKPADPLPSSSLVPLPPWIAWCHQRFRQDTQRGVVRAPSGPWAEIYISCIIYDETFGEEQCDLCDFFASMWCWLVTHCYLYDTSVSVSDLGLLLHRSGFTARASLITSNNRRHCCLLHFLFRLFVLE